MTSGGKITSNSPRYESEDGDFTARQRISSVRRACNAKVKIKQRLEGSLVTYIASVLHAGIGINAEDPRRLDKILPTSS